MLLKKQGGHEHYPYRGGIEQNGGGGHAHHIDGGKVAQGEKQYAAKPRQGKKRDVPGADKKRARGGHKPEYKEDKGSAREAQAHGLGGGKAHGTEGAYKKPHAAPEYARRDYKQRAVGAGSGIFHGVT